MGPKVYRALSKTLHLPSKSTLCRTTSKWSIKSDIDNFIFAVINSKVQLMTDMAKHCVLCADEMSMKSNLFYSISEDYVMGFHSTNSNRVCRPANSTLVLMARGVSVSWKQPVAYFLVNESCPADDMHYIICRVIEKLVEIGLNAVGFISDQGSNFIKLTSKLGATTENIFLCC